MKITFLGATENVTGSRFLVETGKSRNLVDCGLYQERDFVNRNWEDFAVAPASIENVFLTHAHLDHCGYLPKLVKSGFRGAIFCTPPTQEIAQIILLDSAKIQEEDAVKKRERHQREGKRGAYPEIPLYTVEDAKNVFPLFRSIPYEEPTRVSPEIRITLHNAGHILGAATIELEATEGGNTKRAVFSGDIGRWNRPIVENPTIPEKADYLFMESTYGDRLHEAGADSEAKFKKIIIAAQQQGGNVVIPVFATERAQDLLYYLSILLRTNQIKPVPVFIDSPMAINITDVFRKFVSYLDAETRALIEKGESPFSFPQLNISRTTEESKRINATKGTSIILAGSGMCTGGRIKHHIRENITRPESTILFVGYQAQGTLGREITEGARTIRIFNETYPVRAKIENVGGFSAHADQQELLRWVSGFKKPPEKIFIIHGEKETAVKFGDILQKNIKSNIIIPKYQQEIVL
ncbi:MAG: MBL fold metallo-hydrolase [Candidatus Omnitrophica bacterium]|nr:MBL fold metallo-hydrolase [Candidatus Omnitrophota bacterium]